MQRGLNKGYVSMCAYMSACRIALRALTHRLRDAKAAKEKFVARSTSMGNFVGTPRICVVNFVVNLRTKFPMQNYPHASWFEKVLRIVKYSILLSI